MREEKIEKNHYYHIYNRGINGNLIFKSDDNMHYFLTLMKKHFAEKIDVLAYCLLKNHFHFAVQILVDDKLASQTFSNFFNAYVKAFNQQNNRTGTLFERPFHRIKIDGEDYLKQLLVYIHKNPENHKAVAHFENYKFSSYMDYLNTNKSTANKLQGYILNLFGDRSNFKLVHELTNSDVIDKDLSGFENLTGSKTNLKGREPKLAGNKTSDKDLSGFENLTGREEENKFDTNIKDKFFKYIHELQDTITSKLEAIDGKAKFQEDLWKRPEGGGGRTRVIENGTVFEKGGVNISGVHGKLPDSMQNYFGVDDADFFACGLSLVLHPKNPMVPTVHANWRYFEMYDQDGNIVDQWFGGGQDLTPYYLFEDDAKHFHTICKTACDKHNLEFYPKYKARCDEYFYNTHRNEARGIGGLFFDYCKKIEDMSMQNWYDFVTEIGNSFLDAYAPIVEKRKDLEYTKAQRNWQEIRRGRYVEFNLVHDKGTLFGLKTNGRIESILMSLPPHVQWVYDHQPEAGSEEERLIKVLQNPMDWV